jgi:DNA-binding transcriptional regulator YdaS (Cro superfamily)
MKLTDEQIITLLGGVTKVANMCEVSLPAVSQWKSSGIPKDKMMYLAAQLEHNSHGLITRKSLFPKNYKFIWPELN